MHGIRKRIITDEAERPVAVETDHADWLKIEQSSGSGSPCGTAMPC